MKPMTRNRIPTILLLIFLSIIPCLCQAHEKVQDSILFDRAIQLERLVYDLDLDRAIYSKDTLSAAKTKSSYSQQIKEDILEKALACYAALVDSFPRSKLFFQAFNNKAAIEFGFKDYKNAKQDFLTILNYLPDDTKPDRIGYGTMDDFYPYVNYKHDAAKYLTEIYLHDSDYSQGLATIQYVEKYSYYCHCGNGYVADYIDVSTLYGKCYLGLNNYHEAYKILLPNIIYTGLTDNSEIVKLAYSSLLVIYSKANLKEKFEYAVQHYSAEPSKSFKNGRDYSITFLGVKIPIRTWQFEPLKAKDEARIIKKELLGSEFYKMLAN